LTPASTARASFGRSYGIEKARIDINVFKLNRAVEDTKKAMERGVDVILECRTAD